MLTTNDSAMHASACTKMIHKALYSIISIKQLQEDGRRRERRREGRNEEEEPKDREMADEEQRVN